MLSKFIIFKTHLINVTNLFLGSVVDSIADQLYYPCVYNIEDQFFVCQNGKFSKMLVGDPQTGFRKIDWSQGEHLANLKQISNTTSKSIIFGHHDSNQIEFLKDQFREHALTISINYTSDSYKKLLTNVVHYHEYVNKIQNREHLYNEFDRMQLIPRASHYSADYNIDFEDFYDQQKMQLHFDNLQIVFPETYYQTWATASLPTLE